MTTVRDSSPAGQSAYSEGDKKLFWCCFIALVATSFGFIVRAFSIGAWGNEFGLTATQQGEIFGVGLWPFAISIVLFSLIIDKIGYKNAMWFALISHIASGVITIFATGYWSLYIGTFIVALGNGTVEAVINPVVATMFHKEKSKWLNILHAGWPAGLVIGGLLAITIDSWQMKVALIFIPTVIYGIMMIPLRFPVNERVAAGVPFKDMLGEAGAIGALLVVSLITLEIGRVFGFPTFLNIAIIAAATIAYGAYVKSLGRPLFIILLLIMIPLATTELGTDSWITPLMEKPMEKIGLHAGWIIIYTSAIMMILRFFAGPILHRFSPLGLLAMSSAVAAVGLFFLSTSAGIMILVAATIYAFGKAFFWPTILGVTAEQFPRGGALTLNTIGGVGMLGVGIVGSVFLGAIQDKSVQKGLSAYDAREGTELSQTYLTEEKMSVFGAYKALGSAELAEAPPEHAEAIAVASQEGKQNALSTVAMFPVIMLFSFLGLILYFRSRGGYKAVNLAAEGSAAEAKMHATSQV